MTAPDRIALGRRAVACPRWEWRPGMATQHEERVLSVLDDGVLHLCDTRGNAEGTRLRVFFDSSLTCVPDLDDPGTLGCLLALVRETAPDCPVEVCYHPDADPGDGSGWTVVVGDRHTYGTLGASLVAALVAAT